MRETIFPSDRHKMLPQLSQLGITKSTSEVGSRPCVNYEIEKTVIGTGMAL